VSTGTDTESTRAERLLMQIVGLFAEFECAILRERRGKTDLLDRGGSHRIDERLIP